MDPASLAEPGGSHRRGDDPEWRPAAGRVGRVHRHPLREDRDPFVVRLRYAIKARAAQSLLYDYYNSDERAVLEPPKFVVVQ